MYEKILVPVDGSEPSLMGLQEAIRLAKNQNSRLRLLHVVHDFLVASGRHGLARSDDLLKHLRESGQTILTEAAKIVRAQGIEPESESVETPLGPVGEMIVEYAAKWPADLIVIGTHGRRGIRRLVMGSDAEYVIRTTPVPVLLVRATKTTPQD